MRVRWTILGSAGAAGFLIAVAIVARASDVAGDPTVSPSTNAQSSIADIRPGEPLQLGPHAIPYEDLSPEDQAGVDRMIEQEETNQPASSVAAMQRSADQTADAASAEVAARQVGMMGLDEQGVVP